MFISFNGLPMDAENQRIEEDLRGVLRGEVRCDDLTTQLYSTDASVYEIRPLGVVRPRSLKDVVATVEYAAESGIPIFPRGAGSGLAGESLGPRNRHRLLPFLPPNSVGRGSIERACRPASCSPRSIASWRPKG